MNARILVGHFINGESVPSPSPSALSVYQVGAMDFSVESSAYPVYLTRSEFMESPSPSVCLALAIREAKQFSRDIANGLAVVTRKGLSY